MSGSSIVFLSVTIMFSYKIDADTELCLVEERHAEELYTLIDKNRERLYWIKPDYCIEETKDRIKKHLQTFAEGNGFRAGIWFKGSLAGSISYNHIDRLNRSTELGYWIDSSYEGKGLVTKACRVFVDYAFNELKLNRVEIRCNVDNQRSATVAERLGFTREGTLRQTYWKRDQFVDTVVYAVLASEWQTASKRS